MKEVYPNLYCGCDKDYPPNGDNWVVIHAAREPWHRKFVGYEGADAPEGEEYWLAERDGEIAVNLVDAPDEEFFYEEVLDLIGDVLDLLEERLDRGNKVLVHCNQGVGRAPLLCMAYTAHRGMPVYGKEFDECEAGFREAYPEYNPSPGLRNFMRNRWGRLSK